MSTLLLRLAGPMQSWGTRSRFSNRDTELEPSRSGVTGILCAAKGLQRYESLDQFAMLEMAVRVDREGRLMRDYNTVQELLWPSGRRTKDAIISTRYYLADADFLVGLGGDRASLIELANRLKEPIWQLCLGRKAFVPALPVFERIVELPIREAITKHPWRMRSDYENPPDEPLRCVFEAEFGEPRRDVPKTFDGRDRDFDVRYVVTEFLKDSPRILQPEEEMPPCSSADWF